MSFGHEKSWSFLKGEFADKGFEMKHNFQTDVHEKMSQLIWTDDTMKDITCGPRDKFAKVIYDM